MSGTALRWPVIVVFVAFAITSVPYVYGAALSDAEHQFTGVIAWHGDVFYYLAQIRQFGSAPLIANPVAPEPHAPIFFNGLYAPLGVLASVTRLPGTFLYLHAVRLAALLATAWSVLALARVAGLSQQARLVALLFAFFAAGWRWMVWAAPAGSVFAELPYWGKIHVGSTLQQTMTVPHLALAAALVCAVLAFFLRGLQGGSRRQLAGAGVGLAYLTSFHPFEFLPLWIVGGAAAAAAALRGAPKPLGMRRLAEAPLWLLLSCPIALFYAWAGLTSPLFRSTTQQATEAPTETLFLLVYFGPLLLISLAAPAIRPRGSDANRFARAVLVGWILAVLVLGAIPILPQASHMRVGLHLVCAVIAAWVLVDAPVWSARRWPRIAVPVVVLALSAPSFALYVEQVVGDLRLRDQGFFLRDDERAALDWLALHAPPAAVIIADRPEFQYYIAPYTGARPFRGHNAMTPFVGDKDGAIARFFSPDTPAAARATMARDLGLRFIAVTHAPPDVRVALGATWPPRFTRGRVTIHDVYDAR